MSVNLAAKVSAGDAVAFGPFRLLPAQRVLLEGETPVRLGSRALDILIALVERPGEVITKHELMARIWPDTTVEEGNLRVHVGALRKVLGDGQSLGQSLGESQGDGAAPARYIANIPGRGYSFVAPVTVPGGARAVIPAAEPQAAWVPAPLNRMLGRDQAVAAIVARLPRHHFITVVGAGGIGKTTVALAAARAAAGQYHDGARFIDLAMLAEPLLLPGALTAAVGLPMGNEGSASQLLAFLADKQMLLLLDNCDHVLEPAAALAEHIRQEAPGVHILATSRQPLHAGGEHVRRLGPLDLPPTAPRSAAEALGSAAVQLFVERATACLDSFVLTDADAPVVAAICRRLDGIPLAIELAAGRIDAFGLAGLAGLLDDRFRGLTRGGRVTVARHRTLNATVEWSYTLLPPAEQRVLRQLSVFAGDMTLEAIAVVAADGAPGGADQAELMEQVANLVAKSFLSADASGAVMRYRMLRMTRAYMAEQLGRGAAHAAAAQRHAGYCRAVMQAAEAAWESQPAAAWLAAYAGMLDDVRAALDWAFAPGGEPVTGLALVVASVPLWVQLSLMDECRWQVERALAAHAAAPGGDPVQAMKLHAAYGAALLFTRGPGPENERAWRATLALAERLGAPDYRLRALYGLWVGRLHGRDFPAALVLARRFSQAAPESADSSDRLVGERLIGVTLHGMGEQAAAHAHLARMLDAYVPPNRAAHLVRFQFDQKITAGAIQARTLWLEGLRAQAGRVLTCAIDEACASGHAVTLCYVLAVTAIPLAFYEGDEPAATRHVAALAERAAAHRLGFWLALARCYQGVLELRQGRRDSGLRLLEGALGARPRLRYTACVAAVTAALSKAGETERALQVIANALREAEASGERWHLPEMLRLRAAIGAEGPDRAEADLLASVALAQAQGAASWELRSATDLARLRLADGRTAQAKAQALAPLREAAARCDDGFDSADLRAAHALLAG